MRVVLVSIGGRPRVKHPPGRPAGNAHHATRLGGPQVQPLARRRCDYTRNQPGAGGQAVAGRTLKPNAPARKFKPAMASTQMSASK